MNNINLVLFDLDGTIIETAPDLSNAVNYILSSEYNLPPLSLAQNRLYIGGGFQMLFERAFAHYGLDANNCKAAIAKAYDYFDNINGKEAVVYDGVISALQYLRQKNITCGVLTNKIERYSKQILDMKNITPLIDFLIAGDTYEICKPNPEVLHRACAKIGTVATNCILIGDSKFDVETAKNAGALAVCVDYGYSDIPVEELGADLIISSIEDFVKNNL